MGSSGCSPVPWGWFSLQGLAALFVGEKGIFSKALLVKEKKNPYCVALL